MQKPHLHAAGYVPPRPTPRSGGLLVWLREAVRSWREVTVPASAIVVDDTTEAQTAVEDWPSLDVVYDEVQDSITAQNVRLKTIDAKANFGLVAGTLLTAGVTGLGRALVDGGREVATPRWEILGITLQANQVVDWVTITSLGAYALIAICANAAYRLRTFKEAPNPQRLVTKYIYEDPRITKTTITSVRAKNYASNEKTIEVKAWWTNLAMVFLVVEAFLLFVIAVIQVAWL